MAKVLFAEQTPNPLAIKLKLDQKVTTGGGRHYAKKEQAFENPLAQKFLDIHGVETVFFMDDFITVSKTQAGIWDYIFFQTNAILLDAKDIVPLRITAEGAVATKIEPGEFEKLPDDKKLEAINLVLDESIRPGLARDGGGLQVLGFRDNVLSVRYQGACGSCPSSTAQTLGYISNMLQERVSPDLSVQPV